MFLPRTRDGSAQDAGQTRFLVHWNGAVRQPADQARVLRCTAPGKEETTMPRSARVAQIGLLLAIVAAIVLALAPIGYRMGWWPLRVSFYYFLLGAIIVGAVAVIVSLVAAFLTRRTSGAPGFGVALVGVLVGLVVAGYPAAHVIKARKVPPIHDVTTDTVNPPTFVKLADARRTAPNGLDYAGAAIAEQQKQAYPDVTTLRSALAPNELFARAAKIATDDGWEV